MNTATCLAAGRLFLSIPADQEVVAAATAGGGGLADREMMVLSGRVVMRPVSRRLAASRADFDPMRTLRPASDALVVGPRA